MSLLRREFEEIKRFPIHLILILTLPLKPNPALRTLEIKWQIQIRTRRSKLKEMSKSQDLFKLFAWRECERAEIARQMFDSSHHESKRIPSIAMKPIKSIQYSNRYQVSL